MPSLAGLIPAFPPIICLHIVDTVFSHGHGKTSKVLDSTEVFEFLGSFPDAGEETVKHIFSPIFTLEPWECSTLQTETGKTL